MFLRNAVARLHLMARERAADRSRRGHRGAVIVLTTFAMIGLLVFVATAVDIGAARAERTNTQSAADLAVLASLNVLAKGGSFDQASAAAKQIIEQNLGVASSSALWQNCADLKSLENAGGQLAPSDSAIANHCISFKAGSPAIARVRVPTRQVDTTFGKVIGINSIDVTASAGADGDPNRCEALDPTCVEIATTTTTTTIFTWANWCSQADDYSAYVWNWDQCRGNRPGSDDSTRNQWMTDFCSDAMTWYGNGVGVYVWYWDVCNSFSGLDDTDRQTWTVNFCTQGNASWVVNDYWTQVTCRWGVGDANVDGIINQWNSTTTTTIPQPTTTTIAPTTTQDPLRLNY